MQDYNVFFLHEWQIPKPVYYLVDQVEANSPQEALQGNLSRFAQLVRTWLEVDVNDIDDDAIEESLYIVPSTAWLSSREVYWQASLMDKAA